MDIYMLPIIFFAATSLFHQTSRLYTDSRIKTLNQLWHDYLYWSFRPDNDAEDTIRNWKIWVQTVLNKPGLNEQYRFMYEITRRQLKYQVIFMSGEFHGEREVLGVFRFRNAVKAIQKHWLELWPTIDLTLTKTTQV